MKHISFNFIDDTFGEKTECILLWDNEEIIIVSTQENTITVKKYKDMQNLIVEFITNNNELDFLRELTKEQEKNIEELEEKIKCQKKEKH